MLAIEDLDDPIVFQDKDMYDIHFQLNREGANIEFIKMARKLLAIFYSYMSPFTLNWNEFIQLCNDVVIKDEEDKNFKKIMTVRDVLLNMDQQLISPITVVSSSESTNAPIVTFPESKPFSVPENLPKQFETEVKSADIPSLMANIPRGTLVGGGIFGVKSDARASATSSSASASSAASTSSTASSGKSNE